jgi:hypothetical protein
LNCQSFCFLTCVTRFAISIHIFAHGWPPILNIQYLYYNPSLGLTTKARACKVASQEESPGVKESVREWTFTLPKELSLSELESRWTPKCLESNCKGQNPMVQGVFYIIGKLLKLKCLKWACITHLDIWNTSYGQKKGRESNWQLVSRPLKVKNHPNFLACRWHETYRWKALN